MNSNRPLLFTIVGVSFVCFAGGCFSHDDDEAPAEVAQTPDTFAADFKPTPYGVAACDSHDGKLKGSRELRLFNAGGYESGGFTKGLANYYVRHDLTFFTRFAPTAIEMPFALQTDEKILADALRKKFPTVDFDAAVFSGTPAELDEITSAAASLTFEPVLKFIAAHGHQDPAITNVLLVPKVTSSSILSDPRAHVAGLSISPELVKTMRTANDPTAKTWRLIAFPDSFNGMVIIDAPFTTMVTDKKITDLTMAHEFGHSAGLVHVADTTNLMTPVTDAKAASCAAKLTDQQLSTMAATLHVGPQGQGQALTAEFSVGGQENGGQPSTQPTTQARWNYFQTRLAGKNGGAIAFVRELLGHE